MKNVMIVGIQDRVWNVQTVQSHIQFVASPRRVYLLGDTLPFWRIFF